MAAIQEDVQPAQDQCREVDPSRAEEDVAKLQEMPMEKSGVYVDPFAQRDTGRFEPGETVHMAVVQDGVRTKGTYKVHQKRPSQAGYQVYQLADKKGKLYNNGEWVREKLLKAESIQKPKSG